MLMMKSRPLFFGTFLFISASLLFALYLQYFQNIAPCPLCMLQRFVFMVLGVVTLTAAIHNPRVKGLRIYGIVTMLFALAGLGLAARNVWLESLPPHLAPACGPSLEIMLEYLPLFEVLKTAIMGTGDCAKVAWSFLGFSIAYWSLMGFALIFLISASIMIKPVGRF